MKKCILLIIAFVIMTSASTSYKTFLPCMLISFFKNFAFLIFSDIDILIEFILRFEK